MRVLANTKDMTVEEWRELRKSSLGGSDAAVILGLNKWKSAFTLYYEKKGYLEDTADNEAMRIGRDLEQYVAERFCEATGKKVRRRNQMFLHDYYDFISANIDREVVGENAGLECKTTSVFTKSDFEGGEIPLYYYCQCMHYMAVMGYEKMYLAVLVLGKAFYWFEIKRNEQEIESLISTEVEWWKEYIEVNEAPAPDGSESSGETIAILYENSVPGMIFLHGNEETAKGYLEAGKKLKELKELQDKYKNILLAEMGHCEESELDGYQISNKVITRKSLDSKRLKVELPDIYKQYVSVSENRRFILKEVK